jgi:hypothetical protein
MKTSSVAPILLLVAISFGVRADQFDDLKARLDQEPTDVVTLNTALIEASAYDLNVGRHKDAYFYPLRWACSSALRRYLNSPSLKTVDDLVALRRVLTLTEGLRIADQPTIDRVVAIHYAKAPWASRILNTRWHREFLILKQVSLETLRTLVSTADRSHAKYRDPDWNERDGSDCGRTLGAPANQ